MIIQLKISVLPKAGKIRLKKTNKNLRFAFFRSYTIGKESAKNIGGVI